MSWHIWRTTNEECNQVSYLDTIFKSQLEFMTQDKNVDLAILINFTMQEMGSCLSCLYSMSKCRKNDWLLKYTCRFRPKNLNIQLWYYLLLSERLHDMKRWYLIPWVSRKEEIVQWRQCSKHKSSLHVSFFSRKYRAGFQLRFFSYCETLLVSFQDKWKEMWTQILGQRFHFITTTHCRPSNWPPTIYWYGWWL